MRRTGDDARRRAAGESFRPIAASLGLPSAHVAVIDDSHRRCAAYGLSRFESPDLSPLSRSDLAVLRERNTRLFEHAAPVMEMLFEQIEHTQSMVVLCDATGTVLHAVGDDDFLGRAGKVALAPGANWSEQSKGTNGIGTALMAESPTLVHADEHFFHANHFLTCSAAPIVDPKGRILGVLDVSGDHRNYHQHTMALVKMSARMIENHWLSDDYRHVMRLHFHGRPEFIGTLKEGILAVTADGRVVGVNRTALDLLGMSGAAVRMQSLESLLGVQVSSLVDHFRSPLAMPLAAHAQGGQTLHLFARFDWPVWHTIAEAASVATVSMVADAAARPPSREIAFDDAVPPSAPMVWADAAVKVAVDKARRVFDRGIPVLILGELGSGKSTLARALHEGAMCQDEPFLTLNAAAQGAAEQVRELAHWFDPPNHPVRLHRGFAGTLLIDSVADLAPEAQTMLWRALQDVGSRGTPASRPRVICATHQPLWDQVQARRFREDLYYQLNGLTVKLPALRERSDLLELAEHIVARECGVRPLAVSPDVADLLQACAWPGNVRQLVNVMRAACAMAQGEASIERSHLPEDFVEMVSARPSVEAVAHRHAPSMQEIEIEAIREAVASCGGNISEAAKRLGISRNTVYRKLR